MPARRAEAAARPRAASTGPALVRVVDAAGSSARSFEDALADALKSVRREVRAPVGIEVVRLWADLEGGSIATYRVTARVAYRETARAPGRARS